MFATAPIVVVSADTMRGNLADYRKLEAFQALYEELLTHAGEEVSPQQISEILETEITKAGMIFAQQDTDNPVNAITLDDIHALAMALTNSTAIANQSVDFFSDKGVV